MIRTSLRGYLDHVLFSSNLGQVIVRNGLHNRVALPEVKELLEATMNGAPQAFVIKVRQVLSS